MSNEKFNLNWNEFGSSTVNSFKDLLTDEDFTDVTLACDDDKQIKAHKAILSASSVFFQEDIEEEPAPASSCLSKRHNSTKSSGYHTFHLGIGNRGLTENNTGYLSKPINHVKNENRHEEVFSPEEKFLAREVSPECFELDVQSGQANLDDFGLVSSDPYIQEKLLSAGVNINPQNIRT
jgi:hypothetical protein